MYQTNLHLYKLVRCELCRWKDPIAGTILSNHWRPRRSSWRSLPEQQWNCTIESRGGRRHGDSPDELLDTWHLLSITKWHCVLNYPWSGVVASNDMAAEVTCMSSLKDSLTMEKRRQARNSQKMTEHLILVKTRTGLPMNIKMFDITLDKFWLRCLSWKGDVCFSVTKVPIHTRMIFIPCSVYSHIIFILYEDIFVIFVL